ncbi:MAG: flavodoxin family protein [Erysipelotrichaceae bacterium]|nr:flavodoxin family protein [Erysipelotrichaceae bacterium]
MMNILILNGSPRVNGNTKKMINAFIQGANSNNEIEIIDVTRKNIKGCNACEYCHTKGNKSCIHEDDMKEIYEKLENTDMLILASPIYYHGISGQLKCVIDRFYATLYPKRNMRLKSIAMFLASGDPNMYDGAMFSYNGDFLEYLGLENKGVFTTAGFLSEIKLQEIREFGKSLN